MAYPKRPRQEDPNQEIRTDSPQPLGMEQVGTPQVQSPVGGSNRVVGTPMAPQQSTDWWETGRPTRETFQKPMPWQGAAASKPDSRAVYDLPPWSLKDIQANEPQFVQAMSDMLWERFENTPSNQREDFFWQNVRQNVELSAATFVRRMMSNAIQRQKWMQGEEVPTLNEALQNEAQGNDIRQWLDWLRGNRRQRPGGV